MSHNKSTSNKLPQVKIKKDLSLLSSNKFEQASDPILKQYFAPMNEVKISITDSKLKHPPQPMSVRYEKMLYLAEMFPETHSLVESGQEPILPNHDKTRIDKTPDTIFHDSPQVKVKRSRAKTQLRSQNKNKI